MNSYIAFLGSLVSILAIWILLFSVYQDYCVDSFRQKVFSLRDNLFDEAMRGRLPFDHKSYGMLRVTMNGTIRFAHKLNLGLLLYATVKRRAPQELTFHKKFGELLGDLDDEQKRIFMSYMNQLMILIIKHLLISSPILTATILIPALSNLLVRSCIRWMVQKLSAPLDIISTIVYFVGDDGPRNDRNLATG